MALHNAMVMMTLASVSAEFCTSHLYTDSFVCEDGTAVGSNGCCAATNRCPTSCMSSSWGSSGCTCTACNKGRKLTLTQDEQYLKATNYFRCRHGQNMLAWDASVATNAQGWADTCPSQGGNPPHSQSYQNTPSSGENVAAGQKSPEKAVEAWYSEITDPGGCTGAQPASGCGHYTALIWAGTTKLGCGWKACASGSPNPVHVCQYAEAAPNMGGGYVANVPQSNTPTATEDSCCTTVYGGGGGGDTNTPSGNSGSNTSTGTAGAKTSSARTSTTGLVVCLMMWCILGHA